MSSQQPYQQHRTASRIQPNVQHTSPTGTRHGKQHPHKRCAHKASLSVQQPSTELQLRAVAVHDVQPLQKKYVAPQEAM